MRGGTFRAHRYVVCVRIPEVCRHGGVRGCSPQVQALETSFCITCSCVVACKRVLSVCASTLTMQELYGAHV